MAMLAEPRRKQKWSVDPRNTAWSNDDSKFGQKMLEKMGWSKGKGLGAQEQGATEHIKVQVKNNQLGLGASANHEDNWLAPQEEFNQLLAELNSCHGQEAKDFSDKEKKSFSLEEKSKSSKRRVHYTKFTKGKDLSSRSKTDLDCIFGKRQKSEILKEDHNSSAASEEKATPTMTSNLTVQEYFAKRMSELKNKSSATHTTSAETNPFGEKRTKQKKEKKKRKEARDWDRPKAKHPKKESLEEGDEGGWHADYKSEKKTLAENRGPAYMQCLDASPQKRSVCDEQETSTTERKKKKKKKQEEMVMKSAQDQKSERRKKKKKKKEEEEEKEGLE
ncbi:PIN2/TERF1-interacting telomerase inhibitor 1 [Dromiciops gliroides]|uniref:PIN2/TERF1-interacting telomerase inhibitor 1 n=1 Tax=Dromiciops gliroides TaxID=33562 RepID=UPI001CC51B42|nr:PIN2/TERF1-interacting telomerase inhibitor 1 [Dromiciops gliroides]